MFSAFPRLPFNPRVVCLGHALKETLDVRLSRKALELGVQLGGGSVAAALCMSDGGDGFLDALTEVIGGVPHQIVAKGPMGKIAIVPYLYHHEDESASIEMAKCCGLAMVPPAERRIMDAGTGALGEVITNAISLGAKDLHIGLGGSATCDGGIGMLMKLQEAMLGQERTRPHVGASYLAEDYRLDLPGLREKLKAVRILVYCDVQNPLLGPTGAANLFAPQKGATRDQVTMLEFGLESLVRTMESQTGQKLHSIPGAGAAGGTGAALAAIGGRLLSGAEAFCGLIGLNDALKNADCIITSEGRFDQSSFEGKAPWRASQMAISEGKRALIACGTCDENAADQAALGGVEIKPFAADLAPQRRAAEAFARLQATVRDYVASGR